MISKPERAPTRTARLARFCWVLTLAFIAAQLFLKYLNTPATLLIDTFGTLVIFAFATVGLLIGSRRHANPIGWAFAIGALLWAGSGLALEYSVYGLLTAPGSLPAPLWMAILGRWSRSISFTLVLFVVLLLFPDGRLPSPRWRKVAWFLVAGGVASTLSAFFTPDFTDTDFRLASFSNPIGQVLPEPLPSILSGLPLLFSGVAIFACVAAIVVRFRRSGGDERQQMKWLTYSSFLSGGIFVLVLASIFLNLNIDFYVSTLLFDLLLIPVPVSIGIAILKYRLYDIDLIINRTLVYIPLTGILAGLYSATVALMQKLFVALTGEKSDAAIVITTLVLASLFTPVKNALQSLVDRRFKEAPDNTKKLKAFGKEMETTVYDINPQRAASRLLGEAIAAFHAKSGAVYLGQNGNLRLIHAEGDSPGGGAELVIPLQINGNRLGILQLAARHNGLAYNQQERDVLQQVADQAAAAIASSLEGNSTK